MIDFSCDLLYAGSGEDYPAVNLAHIEKYIHVHDTSESIVFGLTWLPLSFVVSSRSHVLLRRGLLFSVIGQTEFGLLIVSLSHFCLIAVHELTEWGPTPSSISPK